MKDVWYRELFVSAALAMVFFTVFVQGSTIKLLVRCLNIQLVKDKDGKLCTDIQV
jgi:NhaP-type Na+/H+ or K+/H+ antiporter